MALAALECAIDGTVNCAKRDEGRVLRTGLCNAADVASAGAATGATGAAGAAGAALGAVRTADFTGTSVAAAALAALAVTLVVALDLLGSAFNSCLLTVRTSLQLRPGRAGRRVGGKPLC